MKTHFLRVAVITIAVAGFAVLGSLGLSYHDALVFGRATFAGVQGISFVSAAPDSRHLLVVRWRMEPSGPPDMPGDYLVWTLLPFRSVSGFK